MSYNNNQYGHFNQGHDPNFQEEDFPQFGENQQPEFNQQQQNYGDQQQYFGGQQQNYGGQQQNYGGQQQYGYQQPQYSQNQFVYQQQFKYAQPTQQPFNVFQTQKQTFDIYKFSNDGANKTLEASKNDDSNPFAAMVSATGDGGNKLTSTVFNPKQNEDFPEIGETTLGFGATKTKKQIRNEELALKRKKEQEEENDKLPTKGSPSKFFVIEVDAQGNALLNSEQKKFVYLHYTLYADPEDMLMIIDWLYTQAFELEEWQKQEKAMYSQAAKKAKKQQAKEDIIQQEEDTNFGYDPKKGFQKKPQPKMTEPPKPRKKKVDAEGNEVKEEKKETKANRVKDVDVVVNEEEVVEVDTTRQPVSMVFIGHVDAGKSTISGNLMIEMGMIDKRTIEKFKQEAKEKGRDSWWLAYVMDSSDEEKAKGKTVEVGRANFETKSKQFTLFDAPGHKNYVPNMIMGAACADYAGLVISARKGEYEAGFEKDGQTREHVQLAKSLGVQKLVVMVNKMDDHSCNWKKERWDEIRTGLMPFLLKTGYKETDISWVPISGLTGANLLKPLDKQVCSWYDGPTFVEIIDNLPIEKRDPDGPLRIPILDKQKDRGIVIHGKVMQGTVRLGDKIALSPHYTPSQVGLILDHKNQVVKYARPGENVQIKLLHIREEDDDVVQKGHVICFRDQVMPSSMVFEAEIELLELPEFKPILSRGYQCMLHMHTFADEAFVKDILIAYEKDLATGEIITKENPKFTRSFATIRARVSTRVPLPLEKFDVVPELGQFTLRDEGKTIAVGKVLRYKPHKVDLEQAAAALAQRMEKQKISGDGETKDKDNNTVFNMETGQLEPKKAEEQLQGIAEEDEDV